ncbi:putative monovalent cation/H+ antiporter subunit B [Thiorhodovibrio winogradskyi]|uniref:Monovalent cation/H+ antiporter subunit B n=1 Tax=Thiorhodovibrio winogradskyi TaxID=77007 RepID=A0ABZ0S7Z6_9GAMM|nr:MnhB domain-containing protein [Thiorhodovibrio winogradskyi]
MSSRLEPKPRQSAAILVVVFLVLLVGLLQWVFFSHQLASPTTGLAELARTELGRAGVTNPVTAVLLNFRALDTLLELAVLLAALLGIWSLAAATPGYQRAGPVYAGMVAWVVPLLILTAGYLLWIGAKAPGGAFQAGALLAAAGVILRLGGAEAAGLPGAVAQRWLAVAGIAVFALVGLGTLLAGRGFLNYPPAWSGWLILLIEIFATLTIATLLAAAYVGSEDEPSTQPGGEHDG